MISVIIPVYNTGKYLRECVNSVLKQSYKNIEIILVDDESTDDSGRICDEYCQQDKRIKVIHKKNGGLSDARNAGINIAVGEYLMFVDSDDAIHPHMISILYDNLVKYQADISICSMWWKIKSVEPNVMQTETVRLQCYEGASVKKLIYGNDFVTPVEIVVAWNKLYRASLFDDIVYPVNRFHEDEFVIHRLLGKSNRVVYTNEKLYYYMQREGSITNSYSTKRICDAVDAYTDRALYWDAQEKEDEEFLLQVTTSWFGIIKSNYEKLNSQNNDCKIVRRYFKRNVRKNRRLLKHCMPYGKKYYCLSVLWGYSPFLSSGLGNLLKKIEKSR